MSFPMYPKYKPSGVEWLGEVPEHWELRRLGFLADERREKVSDRDFVAISVTKQGLVPQLETAAKTDDGDNRRLVRKGDFVINSRSDRRGSAGVAPMDGSVSLINTVLALRDSLVATYAHHLLRSGGFQEEFYRFGKGIVADLWSTNFSEMKDILIPIPTPVEQRAIAAFLDRETAKIDALIAEQEKLIELLAEKRQAVISHAVTKGLNPAAPMKPSGVEWLGDVPAHWDVIRLENVGSFVWGKAHEPFVSVDGPHVCATVRFVSTGGDVDRYCTANLTPAQPGDILMVMSDLPGGRALARAYLVRDDRSFAVNQRVCAIRVNSGDSRYFAYQLDRHRRLLAEDDGANQTHLCVHDFTKLKVLVPSAQEQKRIADTLQAQDELSVGLIREAGRAIDLLRERRSALISATVTGQIDVRNAVPETAA